MSRITFCVRGVISPLLANIYLHYVYDQWVQEWRRKNARGDVIVVRYADGTPVQKSNSWGASPLIPMVRSGI
jgi:retron-type reverse transcriptase